MKLLHNGQAIIVGVEKINLDDFPDLKVVGCPMTSTEHLPEEEMRRRGITLISLKGEVEFLKDVTSTAEHTIGLMIALFRNYKTALSGPYQDREAYKGYTLRGKTLGIIGNGRIGKQVAEFAQGLGMGVMIYEPNMDYNILDWALTPEVLCRLSDVISIHIPLKGNRDFFTREMFCEMKSTAYLINTSRDRVVERRALRWALENKLIAGAAVDFTDDPNLVEYAKDHDNLVLTNHIGGATFEDMQKTEAFIVDKVESFLRENMV